MDHLALADFDRVRNAMIKLKYLVMLIGLGFVVEFNVANASLVIVKIEDAGVLNWEPIEKNAPGFGGNGPISLNWDPYNSFATELLAYDSGYSGGAAAFCFYGDNCALQLTVVDSISTLSLQSFDLGFYGEGSYVQYNVVDLASQTSVSAGSPWVDGLINSLITVNASSDVGFLILFGPDGFNGGINNITYSYTSTSINTPIPAAAWLFGFGVIGTLGFNRLLRLNV